MNLNSLSISRLFGRKKRRSETQPEMERSQLPATSFGQVPAHELKEEPTANTMDEIRRAACSRSGAGITGFVP